MKVKIFCLMLASLCCHADVYQCFKNNQIEFRDKPCEVDSIEKIINTPERDINISLATQHKVDGSSEGQSIEQQKSDKKKKLAEQKKILLAQKVERQTLRLKKREEKLALKEAQKKDKQIKKQKKLTEKLQKIENQLRLGTKLKNQTSLHAQLAKESKKSQLDKESQEETKIYSSEKSCQNQL